MDKSLNDLDENYADITPKLRGKTRHRRRAKLAAALRAEANFGRRGGRVFSVQFWCNFGVFFKQIVQRFVHPQNPGHWRQFSASPPRRQRVDELSSSADPSDRQHAHRAVGFLAAADSRAE